MNSLWDPNCKVIKAQMISQKTVETYFIEKAYLWTSVSTHVEEFLNLEY